MVPLLPSSLALVCWPRFIAAVLFVWLLAASFAQPAHAQLARSFSNITGIKVTRLPNAVVVRIQTDGTLRFGGDYNDWIDVDNGFQLRPTKSVRLRIVQARSKLPAYVPIDAYPIDGAAISLGRSEFADPYFTDGAYGQPQPLVDVELRFAAPVIIRKFTVQPGNSTWFGDYLGPREASIEMANDRRAIVITIIPDRADLQASKNLDRSPLSERKKNLSISTLDSGAFRVEALHAPLRQVLSQVAEATGTHFVARADVADLGVSLSLPRTTPAEFLNLLQRSANLGVREENGALVLGRGDEFFAARSLPLSNLSPDAARLLFPDFLLPFLQSDRQNNALLALQTPLVLDKIQAQLKSIDTPRAQFEVSAQFWELASTKDSDAALRLLRSIGGDRESINSETGETIVRVENGLTDQLSATLRLLSTQGRAHLTGNPRVVVLSGALGSLFLGQTRYVQVIQNGSGGPSARAIDLRIGAQLDVTPRGSNVPNDPIRLEIHPRLSTVDDLERGTGLPTIGIRDLSGTMIVNEGDSVAFAGLESTLDFRTDRRTLRVLPSKTRNRETRSLLVLISARRLSDSEAKTAAAAKAAATNDNANTETNLSLDGKPLKAPVIDTSKTTPTP